MKYKDELTARLSAALGKDCSDVIDELYALAALDETLARRGCAMHEYLLQAPDTSRSTTSIVSEVAERFCMGERTLWDVVYKVTR
jgi:hypothetical protein